MQITIALSILALTVFGLPIADPQKTQAQVAQLRTPERGNVGNTGKISNQPNNNRQAVPTNNNRQNVPTSARQGQVPGRQGQPPGSKVDNAALNQMARLRDRAVNEHGKIDRTEKRLDQEASTRRSISPELKKFRDDDLATHLEYNKLAQKVKAEGYKGAIDPPQMKNVPHTQRTG